jgi:hypothetical protein
MGEALGEVKRSPRVNPASGPETPPAPHTTPTSHPEGEP